jgi:glucans biosynthesis protein
VSLALCAVLICCGVPFTAYGFDFDYVANRARLLAVTPMKSSDTKLPKELQDLSYDQLRDIRFKQDRATWRDAKLHFEVALFHLGLHFDRPVKINATGG